MAALVGCGPVTDNSGKIAGNVCTFITGGDTAASYTLPGGSLRCTWTTLEPAIDGDPATAATVNADIVHTRECAIRATAQSGLVFPAGNTAGVFGSLSRSGVYSEAVNGDVAIVRTYLSGEVQEEVQLEGDGAAVDVNGVTGHEVTLFKLPTTKPFDAVEFAFGNPAETQTVEIFEFCSDVPR